MAAERCYYLDLTKVLAAFLVIFGHLYSSDSVVRLYLYAFHMPLFFIISGVFHKFTGKVNWKRYCHTLLWPITIFIILSILYSIAFGSQPWTNSLKVFFVDLPLGRYKGVLWFLFALLWCRIFTDFILIAHRPMLSALIWGTGLFLPVVLGKRLPFEISQGLMALPFYLSGYLTNGWLKNRKPSLLYLIPFAACLTLTVLITRLHGRVSMVDINFGNLARAVGMDSTASIPAKLSLFGADILLFYLNGLIGSMMMLSLTLLPVPRIAAVTPLSKSLITVLGTQYLFITPLIKYLGMDQPIWAGILLSVGVFVLCYCMHLALHPIYRIPEKFQ